MEFYIPETDFEKADFKAIPLKKNDRNTVEKGLPEQKSKSKSRVKKENSQPDQKFSPSTPKEVEYKIRGPNDHKRPALSEPSFQNKSNPVVKKRVKVKQASPGQINMTPRQARSREIQDAHAPDGWKPQAITKTQAERLSRHAQKNQPSTSPLASKQGLLGDTVLANLENSRHVLRNWLWEKAGTSTSRIAYIEPKDRIYLALRLMGIDVLQVLFKTMTPKEREQFVNILKTPRSMTDGFAAAVQTEFISQVMNQGYY